MHDNSVYYVRSDGLGSSFFSLMVRRETEFLSNITERKSRIDTTETTKTHKNDTRTETERKKKGGDKEKM